MLDEICWNGSHVYVPMHENAVVMSGTAGNYCIDQGQALFRGFPNEYGQVCNSSGDCDTLRQLIDIQIECTV